MPTESLVVVLPSNVLFVPSAVPFLSAELTVALAPPDDVNDGCSINVLPRNILKKFTALLLLL